MKTAIKILTLAAGLSALVLAEGCSKYKEEELLRRQTRKELKIALSKIAGDDYILSPQESGDFLTDMGFNVTFREGRDRGVEYAPGIGKVRVYIDRHNGGNPKIGELTLEQLKQYNASD